MQEILELVNKFGVPLVIVGLFLYDWFTTRKSMNETLMQNTRCLEEIRNTNINTAKSLELLQKSMDNQDAFLKVHDKRCEQSTNGILEINRELEKLNIKINERK